MPVASSQLTIATDARRATTAPVVASPAVPAAERSMSSLYVDSVNGTRPAGAPTRPVGCTQTNVFKRGEQFVLRTWGFEIATGNVLSTENVDDGHFTVPGVARPILNWGAHGANANRVWFWTNAWNIPTTFPLGDTTMRVTFTLDSGKVGAFDYADHDHPVSRQQKGTTTHDHHHHSIALVGSRGLAGCRAARCRPRAFAEPGSVAAPAIPGVAALPGPVVDPGKPAATMKLLQDDSRYRPGRHADHDLRQRAARPTRTSPSPGARPTSTGSSIHAPTASTTSAARRRSSPSCSATATPTRAGAFSVKLKAPQDFGGLHDIYAVVDGLQVAKGGFLIARSATMSRSRARSGR